MSIDLTGIGNRNEYYTNHYFSTMFEDGASARIDEWKNDSKTNRTKTPWAMLNDNAQEYYRIHDRYDRGQPDITTANDIITMALLYLASLGYGEHNSADITVDDETVSVFHEVTRTDKAPMLWVVLAYSKDKDSGIMERNILDPKAVLGDELKLSEDNVEALAAKLLFHTAEPPRFLIVIGIDTIVLIDRNKWNEKRYLEFDLQEIFSRHETTTLQAMSVILHKDSLCPADGTALIDTLDEQSRKHASGVSQDLKYALRESIEMLGNEVLYYLKTCQGRDLENDPVDAGQLTIECLRYMYRMLFVLFIEARPELGYAPVNEQVYASGYSLESLRDIAESIRDDTKEVGEGFYLYETLSKLYELIYTGYPKDEANYNKITKLESVHNIFVIPPLKAHIFDPEYTPMLAKVKIRNRVMLRIIDLMSLTRSTGKKGSRRGRISYANLGINQMGAVYEALLSYRGFIAEQDLYEVKKAEVKIFNELDVGYFVTEQELGLYDEKERVRYESDGNGHKKGELRVHPKGKFIYRLAGREREKSASYYTPESLTQCLVKYALKELLKNKTADEILNLKVCEPAMGSAAFLNEAINQLAEAYLDRKQKELGETISHDARMDELQKVKMYIADNNVYGIDLNPVAVELAEVSLWLNTIYKGGYVPWFGTQLVNGNSLIGARRQVYHESQLTTDSKGPNWYENAPERIPFVKHDAIGRNIAARSPSQVYHFLTGDPGMCNYTDKVIKNLDPEKIKLMGKWKKEFTARYTKDEFNSLIELSKLIDDLWKEQIEARHELEAATVTALDIYGHKDGRKDSGRSIREKDKFLRGTYKSEHARNAGAYARLKFAMDYWCALWFWPIGEAGLLPSRSEFISDMDHILRGTVQTVSEQSQISFLDTGDTEEVKLQDVNLDKLCAKYPRLALVRKIADENKFMHWELEFADIFADRGGFDLVLGNPPWVRLEWNENNLLSDKNPIFAVKKMDAKQTADKREDALKDSNTRFAYFNEYESIAGQQAFLRATTNYSYLGGAVNLFKCFLPQAWQFGSTSGVSAFVHPDGVYDDPKLGNLRERLYPKLRYHFQFTNELKLFSEVDHHTGYSLNVYNNAESEDFDSISNLFAVETIEQCYDKSITGNVPGIKDENGKWNVKGHPGRVVHVGKEELALFAKLFDNSDKWLQAKLPVVHAQEMIEILRILNNAPKNIAKEMNAIFLSQMWNETNSKKDGTLSRDVHFPDSTLELVYSGPHIGIANPIFQTSRTKCVLNSDYDRVDLTNIPKEYIQRCNYSPKCDISEYDKRAPETTWGCKSYSLYRIIMRNMFNQSGERTLIAAIAPPKSAHIHAVLELAHKDKNTLVLIAGVFASLIADFFIKTTGKDSGGVDVLGGLPIIDGCYNDEIKRLTLLLNCLNIHYCELWSDVYNENFNTASWSKSDPRLDNKRFSTLTDEWTWDTPLRTDYERRQALVEIDVLTAMALGLTLDQLKKIYKMHFPVLQQYEAETWYDVNGRRIFTSDKNTKTEWENNIKDAMPGTVFTREIEDDTQPGGPVKRTIEYVAPFDKCDREQDYETAWRFFEDKYKK